VSTFAQLHSKVQDEVMDALRRNERQLGEAFRMREQGVFTNRIPKSALEGPVCIGPCNIA